VWADAETRPGDPLRPALGTGPLVKQQHQVFVALLAAIDALVISAACYAVWIILRWSYTTPHAVPMWDKQAMFPSRWESYIKEPLLPFAIPIVLFSMRACGLYRPRRDRSLWGEVGQLFKASIAGVGMLLLFMWFMGMDAMNSSPHPDLVLFGATMDSFRLQMIGLALVLPVLLSAHRVCFRTTLRALRRRGWNLRHVAIVGSGRLGQIVCSTLARNSWTGINPAYFVSHHDKTARQSAAGRPVAGGLAELESILEHQPVDAVYLALPNSRAAVVPELLRRLERFAVDVRIVPDVNPRHMTMSVSELDGMPILSYRESPLYGLGGFGKRLVDLGGACAALVVFSPVMLLTALGVRLTSPGPIIFRQRRVSLGGGQFDIYKFRTMWHVEDERARASWTERNDPRITPVGRFLRRTSLDELPQLFNVLRGEMSLVGPRPERPELTERFREDWRGYVLRQHVKAGITGWAQVNGLRGDTSLRKRLQLDLYYIRHWSLAFDAKILLLTLFRGFVHRNAH